MLCKIELPLKKTDTIKFQAGDELLLNGVIYTARDAAHKKFHELLQANKPLPFDLKEQIIYYTGPVPTPAPAVGRTEGARPVGSAGPTTSDRMDPYTPELLDLGLSAVVGKGPRAPEVKAAFLRNKALYLGAIGGAGALLAQAIIAAEIIAFPELGAEAVYQLTVQDFPVTVLYDTHGGDLYNR